MSILNYVPHQKSSDSKKQSLEEPSSESDEICEMKISWNTHEGSIN